MKILVVGDQHFRFELPYASAFADGRKSEWEAVKEKIHTTAKDCDAVVLIGDNFNTRHNHSSVIKEFVEFLNGFDEKEVHILVGNHERYGSSTALDFLDKIEYKNWFIYNEPTQANIRDGKGNFIQAMMIPYMTPALLGVETKEEGVAKILNMFPKDAWPLCFAHHAITSSRLMGNVVDHLNEIVLPKEKLEQHFAHVFAGHIHVRQNLFPSIYVTGNIFTNEMGEHDKAVYTYESNGTIDVEVKEIPLPVRGIYKVEWDKDIQNIFGGIPEHSIVKCYVTTPGTDLELVKETLKRFDASIIIEQYPNERTKVHFEDGGLDLSVENMLKLYGEAKSLSYADLKEGFELIKK